MGGGLDFQLKKDGTKLFFGRSFINIYTPIYLLVLKNGVATILINQLLERGRLCQDERLLDKFINNMRTVRVSPTKTFQMLTLHSSSHR